MKKITLIITTMFIFVTASYAEISGLSIGISGGSNTLTSVGNSTGGNVPSDDNQSTTRKSVQDDLDIPSIFAEYTATNRGLGLTAGVSIIPATANIKSRGIEQTNVDETKCNEITDGSLCQIQEVFTNQVSGKLEDHTTYYIQPGFVYKDTMIYGNFGMVSVDLTAKSVNGTSADFTNVQTVTGTLEGAGIKQAFGNWFVKLDYTETDYDRISYNTSNNTHVTLDLDTEATTFSLGRTF